MKGWTTTLEKIFRCEPCDSGWSKLLDGLGKDYMDNEPLPIVSILDINGLHDAVWSLRSITDHDKEIRLFACDIAEIALPIFEKKRESDLRLRRVIEESRIFANNEVKSNVIRNEISDSRYAEASRSLIPAWHAAKDAGNEAISTPKKYAVRAVVAAANWRDIRWTVWDTVRDTIQSVSYAAEMEARAKSFKNHKHINDLLKSIEGHHEIWMTARNNIVNEITNRFIKLVNGDTR